VIDEIVVPRPRGHRRSGPLRDLAFARPERNFHGGEPGAARAVVLLAVDGACSAETSAVVPDRLGAVSWWSRRALRHMSVVVLQGPANVAPQSIVGPFATMSDAEEWRSRTRATGGTASPRSWLLRP